MPISGIKASGARAETVSIAVHNKGGQAFPQSFQQQMDEQERRKYQDRIINLFEEVRKCAPELLEKRDMSVFEEYREKIAELMGEILHHAYLFQPENVRDHYGQRRVYATVTVVDQKMKKLGEELLTQSSEQLNLIGRVDEIRGLILDLFS